MEESGNGVIGVGVNGGFGEIGGLLGRVFGCNMGAFPHLALTAFNAPGRDRDQLLGWFRAFDGTLRSVPVPEEWVFELHGSRSPAEIGWGDDIDLVLDATGAFKTREAVEAHGKPVMICCPPADVADCDRMVVFGINDHLLTGRETFFSAASCTTNAAASVLHALMQGGAQIDYVDLLTVHAVTPSQLKKGDAAAKEAMENIVPAKTGAAKALEQIFPQLAGNLNVECMRVPARTASSLRFIIDCEDFSSWDAASVNNIFAAFAQAHPDLMHFEPPPGDPKDKSQWKHSGHCVDQPFCVYVDGRLTQVQRGGRRVIVTAFYDNRVGYTWQALRVAEDWARKRLALQQAEDRAAK
jgi:glyceraldehyde-3-phosphate dehydrogenase type I